MISCRSVVAANAVAVAMLIVLLFAGAAQAQSLRVVPVNIEIPPGQKATSLTVTNESSAITTIQIRAYEWTQPDGNDQLTASNELLASPPLASIPPGETQVVRLVLRRTPEGREATYRILLDQIPATTAPGMVQLALRMSIPIFVQPATRAVPHVQFRLELAAGQIYLVGINDGLRHETIRNIELQTSDGRKLKTESGASPYILAATTRRWRIVPQGALPLTNDILRLTALADVGAIQQQVRIVEIP